ncbi:rifin [Plasmodium reichenowi]|uniref:Rifin n=1 Tax=Plasmodium reichenowi TaxID=5854 RepID=A0A060RMG3_PLARE|nr:rifin [Plasmodium reichenowi]
MKLHYYKILLFVFPLNISLTLYVYSKNKPYITLHDIPTTKSRVLSEKDIQSSSYDKDAEINSVKEIFERQTSQRFEEYEERMKGKRQKRKEKRDKNIQKIIQKDKMEKNLAEKIEKGCFRCGYGLGGVAGSVGVFGGLGIYGWKSAALATAKEAAEKFGAAQGAIAGAETGKELVIAGIKSTFGVSATDVQQMGLILNATNYMEVSVISNEVYSHYSTSCVSRANGLPYLPSGPGTKKPFCYLMEQKMLASVSRGQGVSPTTFIQTTVEEVVEGAKGAASVKAAQVAAAEEAKAIKTSTDAIEAASTQLYGAIGYSVLAILIIVLVMIIIYLVLRYRRKKKKKKKTVS